MRELLARYGFHFSKSKGQNFLTEQWVPRRLAEAAGADAGCGVLEVGPGIGPLTQALCARAEKVVAVELDTTLRPVLAETMAGVENLELIFGDVLKLDVAALVREKFAGLKPLACANLPYYITSPILEALLQSRAFAGVTVMVQKEVAQRICAAPGTPNYSAFTVFCQYYAVPEICFDIPPNCFLPQPKVTSAALRLTARTQPVCEIVSEEMFFRVMRAGFAQRRKTLVNGLCAAFGQYGKAELQQLLRECGVGETVRGETLGIPEFAAIANRLARGK